MQVQFLYNLPRMTDMAFIIAEIIMSRSCSRLSLLIAMLSAWLALPASVHAQPQGSAGLLPEGQTLVSLSVTERRSVVPDRLVAMLRVEQEDRDAQVLQQRINTMMERALERIGEPDGITISTGRYAVYQYDRQPQGGRGDTVWRGSQTITLETANAHSRVHELAGELQDTGFVMNQLSWELSRRLADETRDTMLAAAINRAQEQAQRAGQALGRPDVELAEVTVERGADFSPMMMRSTAAMDMSESSSPSSRPGETEVTLTISVRAVAR